AESAYRRLKPDLMITDGTVHHSAKVKGLPFVGYIKKHRKRYVPSEKSYIFRELKLGERTPIVRVHSQPTMEGEGAKSFDKFTWYVRISEHEGISGIARLEVSAGVGLSRAKELADMTAWIIPKFASAEFSDRRAPHNLTPIKHLENALRSRLGSQAIIRRVLLKELLTNR
ncbi:DNA double-strand break repair nuclease NurA, partial [Hydrogenivirga sp.]